MTCYSIHTLAQYKPIIVCENNSKKRLYNMNTFGASSQDLNVRIKGLFTARKCYTVTKRSHWTMLDVPLYIHWAYQIRKKAFYYCFKTGTSATSDNTLSGSCFPSFFCFTLLVW